MTPQSLVALALADSMLAGEATAAGLARSAAWSLGRSWPWVAPLCRALWRRAGAHFPHYSRDELAQLIVRQRSFAAAWQAGAPLPAIVRYCLRRAPAPAAPAWLAPLGLPGLAGSAELARWLRVTPGELAWYADQWRDNAAADQALGHYRYRWLAKRSGGLRLLEMPKLRLRAIQRQVLRGLLDRVPAHPAAHGFRRGRSCATHAALHTGQALVLRIDLQDFFPSIPAPRVQALFAKLGYPDTVAGLLARLCTHRAPGRVLAAAPAPDGLTAAGRAALRTPHLPQGAPTSPALANLCAYRLDLRVDALARSLGATYSRYADDLAFSGGAAFARAAGRFAQQVAAIALEEGFRVQHRKTRAMRAGTRQQLTGIVVNRHPNLPRADFDVLKATLNNCVRHGPASQNREGRADFRAWLAGRLAYLHMLNPQRGLRLRRLFEQIDWG
ncbi:reverse transcriptase family protein [Janthinobacterium fluminis]|uniref:RNA-directed DNA polymerase n=1 Tax=Janthinobacterium fluminis TaxID=2987524 RepID=A0ABT5K3E4_9BURK|nr:reverse transcriptase family protein [Janthinobacterium fluminis]MDC8758923.1 reverse transcriptase family protein [Janthinobacterium fluminis]